ncbi:hypothetical protein DSAG12_00472 [Promethearchaeum syntrophicum]|uniref:Uncharacterized protein n=1 Tax=Promethearchaeum syntrophicum TaxID=2594042 RepID=A0A5B9D6B2_9ARCH|nr:hypothetical protein [Candidatus Prometheoarchaeum syntrophicum]QEE14659.1 hypothetical protein DSAG12_00472 [Candidatus Prometheoarchaeum syntrophicum]
MIRIKKKFLSIFLGLFLTSIILLTSNNPAIANLEMGPLNFDGIIGDTEWIDADVRDQFFIDADNSDGNIDGNNSLLIGEDEENLYIGLDLNCDQTVDPSSEWVGIWLNTNNSSFSGENEWLQTVNDGAESLIVNVSSEELWEPFGDSSSYDNDFYPISDEDLITPVIYGDYFGNYQDLVSFDSLYYGLNSTAYLGYNVTRLDIEFDLQNFYGQLLDDYIGHIQRFNLYIRSDLNTTIDSHRVVAWKPDGTLDLDDPNQNFNLSKNSVPNNDWGYINSGNLTAENTLKISIIANSSSLEFEVLYDRIFFYIEVDSYNHGGPDDHIMDKPLSSIKNAEYSIGFGPSSLNSTSHRQFEFKIPKSELEHYDANQELGIIVGGYGTMSFEDKDFWCYSKSSFFLDENFSDQYLYYDMQGVESGDGISINRPSDIIFEHGQIGNYITWIISDINVHSPTYTIYQNGTLNSTGEWTSGSLIIVDVNNLIPGIYNYTIIAFDGYGGSIQDDVSVIILSDSNGVAGYPYFLFIGIAIVSISILSKKIKKIGYIERVY